MQDNGDKSGPVALLDGAPTDNNATLFKQGYEKAITDAGYTVAADQAVPDWDNTKAGTIFEQMYTKANGNFVGVASANDGLGGAVVAVLKRNGDAGQIPTTGQDATAEGLQHVLLGEQCLSVYKAIKKEADAASGLAISLIKGDKAAADAAASGETEDTETKQSVKSVLLQPEPIFADDVQKVVDDGFVKASDLCTTAALKKACADHGVS
jgi:D-xylose transport system substrate-binding protein